MDRLIQMLVAKKKAVLTILIIVISVCFYFIHSHILQGDEINSGTYRKSKTSSIEKKLDNEENLNKDSKKDGTEKTDIQMITVDVSGAVVNPGVYTLPYNSRVIDFIKVAGGVTKEADLTSINQAKIAVDASKIIVRTKSNIDYKTELINLNYASAKELESIDGIGPQLAKRIIEYQREHGFRSVDDLSKVKGISKSKLEKIRQYVNVD